MIVNFIGMSVQIAISLVSAFFGAQLINALVDYVSNEGVSAKPIFVNLALSASLLIVEQLAWRYLSYAHSRSYLTWHTQLTPQFLFKISGLDIQRFENSDFNKLINKVTQDYGWKPADFMAQCYNVLHGVLRMVSTAIVLVSFSPWLVLLLLFGVVPSLLVEQMQAKIKWDIWHLKGDASRRYHKVSWMMQNKQDISDMRLFDIYAAAL